jgi:hypothetical protein
MEQVSEKVLLLLLSLSPLCRIFTHISETNNFPKEYNVAAIIYNRYRLFPGGKSVGA